MKKSLKVLAIGVGTVAALAGIGGCTNKNDTTPESKMIRNVDTFTNNLNRMNTTNNDQLTIVDNQDQAIDIYNKNNEVLTRNDELRRARNSLEAEIIRSKVLASEIRSGNINLTDAQRNLINQYDVVISKANDTVKNGVKNYNYNANRIRRLKRSNLNNAGERMTDMKTSIDENINAIYTITDALATINNNIISSGSALFNFTNRNNTDTGSPVNSNISGVSSYSATSGVNGTSGYGRNMNRSYSGNYGGTSGYGRKYGTQETTGISNTTGSNYNTSITGTTGLATDTTGITGVAGTSGTTGMTANALGSTGMSGTTGSTYGTASAGTNTSYYGANRNSRYMRNSGSSTYGIAGNSTEPTYGSTNTNSSVSSDITNTENTYNNSARSNPSAGNTATDITGYNTNTGYTTTAGTSGYNTAKTNTNTTGTRTGSTAMGEKTSSGVKTTGTARTNNSYTGMSTAKIYYNILKAGRLRRQANTIPNNLTAAQF